MTFYLIGVGLNERAVSLQAIEAIKKSKEVFLENYTVDFPYEFAELESSIGKKIKPLKREEVENEKILSEAKKHDIALLVYGNPLSATTHISLILSCKKKKIPYKIIHAESILTAIAETGLQLYKFGKTASMPKWQKSFEPTSFFDIILQNQEIKAHTLLLTDIGLSLKQSMEQLEEVCKRRNTCFNKIVICSQVGKNTKIFFDPPKKLKDKKIPLPFCIIIPAELHFLEQEALDVLKE
jgi:diphthine synthase